MDILTPLPPMEEAVRGRYHIGDVKGCHPIFSRKEAHNDEDCVSDDPENPVVRDGFRQPQHTDNAQAGGKGVKPRVAVVQDCQEPDQKTGPEK